MGPLYFAPTHRAVPRSAVGVPGHWPGQKLPDALRGRPWCCSRSCRSVGLLAHQARLVERPRRLCIVIPFEPEPTCHSNKKSIYSVNAVSRLVYVLILSVSPRNYSEAGELYRRIDGLTGILAVRSSSLTRESTVLYSEDEPLIRWWVADELRLAGFKVIEAENARGAVEVISSGVSVHVLITDLNMPGDMNGEDLAIWVAKEFPLMPVIVVSADPPKRCQPLQFFAKPINMPLLINALRELASCQR